MAGKNKKTRIKVPKGPCEPEPPKHPPPPAPPRPWDERGGPDPLEWLKIGKKKTKQKKDERSR